MSSGELAANIVTLALLILAFGFKTLIFRRASIFGTSLAVLAFAIFVLWLGVMLSTWWPFFAGVEWRIFIRVILIGSCLYFLESARRYYGGVRPLLAEATLGLLEIVQDLFYVVRLVKFTVCDFVCCRILGKGTECRHWCKRPRRSRLRSPSSAVARATKTS